MCAQLSRIPHTLLVSSLAANSLTLAVKSSNFRSGIQLAKKDSGSLRLLLALSICFMFIFVCDINRLFFKFSVEK